MIPDLDFVNGQPYAAQQIVIRQNAIPYHLHRTYELLHIRSGSGTYCIGSHLGLFQSGDLFLISPNLPHRFVAIDQPYACHASSPIESTLVHFRPDCFGNKFLDLPENRRLRHLFDQTDASLKITGEHRNLIVERMLSLAQGKPIGFVVELLWIFSLLSEAKPAGCRLANNIVPSDPQLSRLAGYIDDHLHHKMTIHDIANHMHMSVATCCRFFRRHMDTTFSNYLCQSRLHFACALMKQPDLSIHQIALSSGFNSLGNFISKFKRYTGFSPREYRLLLRKICADDRGDLAF